MAKTAKHSAKLAALLFDIALTITFVSIPPLLKIWTFHPSIFFLFFLTLLSFLFCFTQRLLFGMTLGQLIWGLRTLTSEGNRPLWPYGKNVSTTQKSLNSKFAQFLTVVLLFSASIGGVLSIQTHPLYLLAKEERLTPFNPNEEEWSVVPFFYSVGAWPRSFNHKPILFTIPYLKGPPKNFIGKVVARWRDPDITLSIVGPKTPDKRLSIEKLKACLQTEKILCTGIRKIILYKHILSMQKLRPSSWKMRWFEVDNPNLQSSQRARGIHLVAKNQSLAQERYIIITNKGAHQTFILDRGRDKVSTDASALVAKMIRSLSVQPNLFAGKALLNQQLATTNLEKLPHPNNPELFINTLASIQTQLVAKITVDPKDFDAFYHIAGTSFLLVKHAAQLGLENLSPTQWAATVKPNIGTAYRYATDINQNDPRIGRLGELWEDVQKY